MDFALISQTLPDFIKGVGVTIQLLSLSLVAGGILAILLALARRSRWGLVCNSAWVFTYVFRGTPLLVQMYLIYYGIGQFSWMRASFLWHFFSQPYFCALLSLMLNNAAYTAEILYNARNNLPRNELEACRAFGMSRWKTTTRFIIPTVMRISVQAYSNEVIFMLHATAIVSLITLSDITGVARLVYATYYAPFEAFITAGMLYLALTLMITFVFRRLERRLLAHLSPT